METPTPPLFCWGSKPKPAARATSGRSNFHSRISNLFAHVPLQRNRTNTEITRVNTAPHGAITTPHRSCCARVQEYSQRHEPRDNVKLPFPDEQYLRTSTTSTNRGANKNMLQVDTISHSVEISTPPVPSLFGWRNIEVPRHPDRTRTHH